MLLRNKGAFLLWIGAALVILCSIGSTSEKEAGLLIPIGRIAVNNQVQLSIDAQPYQADMMEDGSGGFWFRIPLRELEKKAKINVLITKTTSNNLFHDKDADVKKWTAPCYLMNSDNVDLLAKARQLTTGCTNNDQKAKAILDFVANQIKFTMFPGMHYQTASGTLKNGYGICVNHSRLFVALCRAVDVPARTVSGACTDASDVYFHHEWVEFYDDNQDWHPLDPTSSTDFNLVDLKRIDLIYDIESNCIYSFGRGWEIDKVRLDNGDISIFCPDWDLQKLTGQMSYRMLSNDSPRSVEVSAEYDISRYLI